MNILQLPAYHVTTIENSGHDYHINAETVTPHRACTHCQHPESVGFGRRVQLVKDLPMHGKRVGIYIDTRGYSFEALRAKILFTEGAHQKRRGRPKFERQDTSVHVLSTGLNLVSGASYVPPSVCEQPFEYGELMNYGVDISTLTRLIEDGLL